MKLPYIFERSSVLKLSTKRVAMVVQNVILEQVHKNCRYVEKYTSWKLMCENFAHDTGLKKLLVSF